MVAVLEYTCILAWHVNSDRLLGYKSPQNVCIKENRSV